MAFSLTVPTAFLPEEMAMIGDIPYPSKEEEEKPPYVHFMKPDLQTDIILKVEDTKFHVNKTILSCASPVFREMFFGNFKEKNEEEVELPDKISDEIYELLLCIYPSVMKAVSRETVDVILKLCEEYLIDSLKIRCEEFSIGHIQHTTCFEKELVHFIYLADRYCLHLLRSKAIKKLLPYKHYGDKGLSELPEFKELSNETLCPFSVERVKYLETKDFKKFCDRHSFYSPFDKESTTLPARYQSRK